jgi:hypothetical protein
VKLLEKLLEKVISSQKKTGTTSDEYNAKLKITYLSFAAQEKLI